MAHLSQSDIGVLNGPTKGIRLLQRLLHFPRRIVRESVMVVQIVQCFLNNRFGKRSATVASGPVVSLTTYGKRSQKVYFAIESIARGSVRPSRLILWIDDKNLINNLPATLRRLKRRGLEVRFCKNYGPHTKYYPYVESETSFNTPLVTADDDILYPRFWLKTLIEANHHYPDAVNCYWAHVMDLNGEGIGKYSTFTLCSSTHPSFRHIALGVMGVIYPPLLLLALKNASAAFEDCCPKGDDLWLHVQALRAGYKVRQIFPRLPYFSFHGVPGTQHTALSYENVAFGDGNDRQIAATYNETDIQLLRTA